MTLCFEQKTNLNKLILKEQPIKVKKPNRDKKSYSLLGLKNKGIICAKFINRFYDFFRN